MLGCNHQNFVGISDLLGVILVMHIGVGRFRILGVGGGAVGARFRILGGPRFKILGGARGAKFPAGT